MNRKLKKTFFLATLLVSMLCVTFFQAEALDKIRISQAVESCAYIAVDYAFARGFYREQGIDLDTFVSGGGGADQLALLSGDVQLNNAAPSYQVNHVRQGRDVILVLNTIKSMNQSLTLSADAVKRVGVSPDAPIEDRLRALKGLRLGITRPGAMTDRHIRFLLRKVNLKPEDAKLVAIGGPQALITALETKQIDGFAISIGPDLVAASRGAVTWVNNLRGDVPGLTPFPMVNIYTTRRYAEKNPEIVKKFIRATKQGMKELAEKSIDEIVTVLTPRYKNMSKDLLRDVVRVSKPALNPGGEVTLEMMKNMMVLEGSKDITPEKMFSYSTNEYNK